MQDLDLSGGCRCSESDGDDSGRCGSDRQERAHVEPHFILDVQATNVVDNTILSTAASSDKNHNARLPATIAIMGWWRMGAAGVSGQAAANVPLGWRAERWRSRWLRSLSLSRFSTPEWEQILRLDEIRSLPQACIDLRAPSFPVLPSPNTTLGQANLTSSSTSQSQHTSAAALLLYSF